jgi:hypothetical protein
MYVIALRPGFSSWSWPALCVGCLAPAVEALPVPEHPVAIDMGTVWEGGFITANLGSSVPPHSIPYCARDVEQARAAGGQGANPPWERTHSAPLGFRYSPWVWRFGVAAQVGAPESYAPKTRGSFSVPPEVLRVRLSFGDPRYAALFASQNVGRLLPVLMQRDVDGKALSHEWMLEGEVLGQVWDPAAAPGIVQLMRAFAATVLDKERFVAGVLLGKAADGLGGLGPAASGPVIEALSDASPVTRQWMAYTLRISGDPAGVPELARVARADPDEQVRNVAVLTLGKAYGDNPMAQAALETIAAEEPKRSIRKTAAKLLKRARRG